MKDTPLMQAITEQGRLLTRRAEWLQKMIEHKNQTILNSQQTLDHFAHELAATNRAIDALRDEYRRMIDAE